MGDRKTLSDSEIGALAHLYRGEVYRSTIWRTRLDTTTNWAVVTLGVALSIAFSSPQASPLPLVLVGILIMFFLMLEARRYRYFNVWRARCRWIETNFYAPLLEGRHAYDGDWRDVLSEDYLRPRYHVSMLVALGRRIRHNYLWILLIQSSAYLGKIVVHPTPATNLEDLITRAAVGPVSGWIVLGLGAAYCISWAIAAYLSRRDDRGRAKARQDAISMG